MCFLINISKYISIPIFTEWIGKVDLIKFDTSLCNFAARNLFLTILENHRKPFQDHIFRDFQLNRHSHLMIRYAKARGYSLNDFTLIIISSTVASFQSEIDPKDKEYKAKFSYLRDVKSIEIRVAVAKDAHAMGKLLECSASLEYLKTSGYNFFDRVGQHCINLKYLEILPCRHNIRVDEVFRYCKGLTHFTWTPNKHCSTIGPCLLSMAVYGRSLEYLKLYASYGESAFMIFSMHGTRNKLTIISLGFHKNLVLNALLWFRGKNLQKLSLNRIVLKENYSFEGVKGIGSACPNLTSITLLKCSGVLKPEVPIEILSSLPGIKFVNIDSSNANVNIMKCYAACKSLEELNCRAVWPLKTILKTQFNWSNLTVLKIECYQSTPFIVRQCRNLKDLTLHAAHNVDFKSVFLPVVSELTDIHILDVATGWWMRVDEAIYERIAAQCKALKEFYCCHSPNRVACTHIAGRFRVYNNRYSKVEYSDEGYDSELIGW